MVVPCALLVAAAMSFGVHDTGAEDVGNWFHARLFFEDGGFINLAKSALYQAYLMPFSFLPYPDSIIVERFASTFIGFTLFAWSMSIFFGTGIGILVALVNAPDVLLTTPTSQVFATVLAFSAFAIRVRFGADARVIAFSYALLLAAWAFRSNTMLILLVVLAWDFWLVYRDGTTRSLLRFESVKVALPVVALVALIGFFAVNQSPHRWNNYQLLENQWQPPQGQIASVMSQTIANYSRWEDPQTGGVPFTVYHQHKRFFGDANTFTDMLRTNPEAIFSHILHNVGAVMVTTTGMTNVGQSLLRYSTLDWDGDNQALVDHRIVGVAGFLSLAVLFLCALWFLFRVRERRMLIVLLLGMALTVAVSGLLTNGSSTRILYPVYPMIALILGACCAAVAARSAAAGKRKTGYVYAAVLLALFSQVGWARADVNSGWAGTLRNIHQAAHENRGSMFHIGDRPAVYHAASRLIGGCTGLMPAELPHGMLAFGGVPADKLYSPFEIPPFGRFGASSYDGLRPDRIDCLYIPNQILTAGGAITNIKRRYDHFIKPYGEMLVARGAKTLPLEDGYFIVPPATDIDAIRP